MSCNDIVSRSQIVICSTTWTAAGVWTNPLYAEIYLQIDFMIGFLLLCIIFMISVCEEEDIVPVYPLHRSNHVLHIQVVHQ